MFQFISTWTESKMYTCMQVCTYVCIQCGCTCMYMNMYACVVCVRICTRIHVCLCVYMGVVCIYACMYMHVHLCGSHCMCIRMQRLCVYIQMHYVKYTAYRHTFRLLIVGNRTFFTSSPSSRSCEPVSISAISSGSSP